MIEAWLCPRCKRMNAPFNPTCFCKPEEYNDNSIEKSPAELSPQVMDAAHYLGSKGQAEFKPMELPAGLPYGYKKIYSPRS